MFVPIGRERGLAAEDGVESKGRPGLEARFGGKEVVFIIEFDRDYPALGWNYRLLSTSGTGTMQKELNEAGDLGYQIVGMTIGQTLVGGKELVSITRRKR